MQPKFKLTSMFFQCMIFVLSLFDILTQSSLHRQPTKLIIQSICICSFITLSISLYNYFKEDKE